MTRQTVEIIIYRFTSYDIIIAQLTQGSSSTPEGDMVGGEGFVVTDADNERFRNCFTFSAK